MAALVVAALPVATAEEEANMAGKAVARVVVGMEVGRAAELMAATGEMVAMKQEEVMVVAPGG